MTPHAFIAMPFGIKPARDGELSADDIRADMFQQLLVADLVPAG